MTNRERAERGRRAFQAVPHDDNDPITNLYDLVLTAWGVGVALAVLVLGKEIVP